MERIGSLSRRDLLIAGAAAGTATLLTPGVHAQGNATIKVGLIGCGGRGTGAAVDAINAAPGVEIWSLGDVFQDRVNGAANSLSNQHKDKYKVTDDRKFVGFDAYKGVIASGCDMVILAAPPGFRPVHLRAAVDAGKHVFMEKPVAVDAPGVISVIESGEIAKRKGLGIVAGTQRRHDNGYVEVMKRIHDGAIGDIVACYAYWNQGGLWMNARRPEWSDMEWQLRNWLYFTWLSGDHISEQHIHNIDVCNWAMKAHPVKAISLGGRQVRTDPAYGHIYDHFATEFEYENGVKMISMCRQIDGTAARVSEWIVGTKGASNGGNAINGSAGFYYDGDRPNPYMLEHKHLIESVRAGKPLNEARTVAESTMTAILGRMAAYTGGEITWEQAMKSTESLVPTNLSMASAPPVPPVAMPGKTKLV